MMKITAQQLADTLVEAEVSIGWFDDKVLTWTTIDGSFDLEKAAEILNEQLEKSND